MIVAGLLLRGNLEWMPINNDSEFFSEYANSWTPINNATRGWPIPACIEYTTMTSGKFDYWFKDESLAIDCAVALLILAATTFACEILPPRLTRLFKRGE